MVLPPVSEALGIIDVATVNNDGWDGQLLHLHSAFCVWPCATWKEHHSAANDDDNHNYEAQDPQSSMRDFGHWPSLAGWTCRACTRAAL